MKPNKFNVVTFGIIIGIIGIVIMTISALFALLQDKLISGILGLPGLICIVISLLIGYCKYSKSVKVFGWTSEEVYARLSIWVFSLTFFLSVWVWVVSNNVIIMLLGAFSAGVVFMASLIVYSFKNKRRAMAKEFMKQQEKKP